MHLQKLMLLSRMFNLGFTFLSLSVFIRDNLKIIIFITATINSYFIYYLYYFYNCLKRHWVAIYRAKCHGFVTLKMFTDKFFLL